MRLPARIRVSLICQIKLVLECQGKSLRGFVPNGPCGCLSLNHYVASRILDTSPVEEILLSHWRHGISGATPMLPIRRP